jgi:hypothetical protein
MAQYIQLRPECIDNIERFKLVDRIYADPFIGDPSVLIILLIGSTKIIIIQPNEKFNHRPINHRSMASPVPFIPKKETPGQKIFDF